MKRKNQKQGGDEMPSKTNFAPGRKKHTLIVPLGVIALLCALMASAGGQGCISWTTVEPGEVAIKVNLVGSADQHEFGKIDEANIAVLKTQRIFYSPFFTAIYKVPTKAQTYSWTADSNEQSPTNEEISFDSLEGATIRADLSMSLIIDGNKAAHLYNTFHMSAERVIRTYIRSIIRITFNEICQKMGIDEIREKKSWIGQRATEIINERVATHGIRFQYINFIGELRYPHQVKQAIDNILSAKQDVQQEIARKAQIENDNKSATINASAEYEKRKNQTDSEAARILTVAQSEADYYKAMIDLVGKDNFMNILASEKLIKAIGTGRFHEMFLDTRAPIAQALNRK
jgi:regulator of protease activity HflC (stomatin/prohibitin superfamily)